MISEAFKINDEQKYLAAHHLIKAFWRRLGPMPEPDKQGFDERTARVRVRNFDVGGASIDLPNYKIILTPMLWTRTESLFYVQAVCLKNSMFRDSGLSNPNDTDFQQQFDSRLAEKGYPKEMSSADLLQLVRESFAPRHGRFLFPHKAVVCGLINLLTPIEFIEFWRDISSRVALPVMAMFRKYRLIYMTDEEIEVTRAHIRKSIGDTVWRPSFPMEDIPINLFAASLLGMHDVLLPIVEGIEDGYFKNARYLDAEQPQVLVYGLNDSDLMMRHFERLSLRLNTKMDHAAWLAHAGSSDIDRFTRNSNVLRLESYQVQELVDIFMLVKAMGNYCIAPLMIRLSIKSHLTMYVDDWLRDFPLEAFLGLYDLPPADQVLDAQRRKLLLVLEKKIKVSGFPPEHLDKLREVKSWREADKQARKEKRDEKKQQEEKFAQAVTAADTPGPDWLEKLFSENAGDVNWCFPEWLAIDALSPIVIDGYELSQYKRCRILDALRNSGQNHIEPLLSTLRAACESRGIVAFDDFIGDLFKSWADNGCDAKQKWCLLAIGMLASDVASAELLLCIKEWRKTGKTQRANMALSCFVLRDTQVSLTLLHGISQSPSMKSLQTNAQKLLADVAESRGLTLEQLEDRIVPTFGITTDQPLVLNLGARKFRLVIGKDLKPYLKDEDGKVRANLPAPGKNDDENDAKVALNTWSQLKKEIRAVLKVQSERLEKSMLQGRRWSLPDFSNYVVNHPILSHLAQTIIWGVYDEHCKLIDTFRIDEDKSFLDDAEKPVLLNGQGENDKGEKIGVVHPLQLSGAQLEKWGEIKSEYEMLEVFPQLGREIHTFTNEEKRDNKFERFAGKKLNAIQIPSVLSRRYWRNGAVWDSGIYYNFCRYFPAQNVTAMIGFDGIAVYYPLESEDQHVSALYFLKGEELDPFWHIQNADVAIISLSDVDPVVVSETLGDLELLLAKTVDG